MAGSMISTSLTLRLVSADGPMLPLETELRYSTDDPLAVVVLFDTGEGEPIRWVFARDLLAQGLDAKTGDGDITVLPVPADSGQEPVIHIRLQSPDGDALIEADSSDIERFLAQTWRLVAPGTESQLLNLDEMLEALLDDV